MLAKISVGWYTRLEQGQEIHPSDAVLLRLATALQLDDDEREHLLRLGRGLRVQERSVESHVRDRNAALDESAVYALLQPLLTGLNPTPALVMRRTCDIVAWNDAYAALAGPALTPSGHRFRRGDEAPVNALELVFSRVYQERVADWPRIARAAIQAFRTLLAEAPDDPRMATVLSGLTASSPMFRQWWARYEVWRARGAVTEVHAHPTAGRIEVGATVLRFFGSPELLLTLYVPCDPASAAALGRLLEDLQG